MRAKRNPFDNESVDHYKKQLKSKSAPYLKRLIKHLEKSQYRHEQNKRHAATIILKERAARARKKKQNKKSVNKKPITRKVTKVKSNPYKEYVIQGYFSEQKSIPNDWYYWDGFRFTIMCQKAVPFFSRLAAMRYMKNMYEDFRERFPNLRKTRIIESPCSK